MKRHCAEYLALLLAVVIAGCASLPATTRGGSAPSRLENSAIAPAALAPFCLRYVFTNENAYVYSRNSAQAFVQEGPCETGGARRAVQRVTVGWRFKGGRVDSKTCDGTDACAIDDRSYGVAEEIVCVSGKVTDGPLFAAGTTDYLNCAL